MNLKRKQAPAQIIVPAPAKQLKPIFQVGPKPPKAELVERHPASASPVAYLCLPKVEEARREPLRRIQNDSPDSTPTLSSSLSSAADYRLQMCSPPPRLQPSNETPKLSIFVPSMATPRSSATTVSAKLECFRIPISPPARAMLRSPSYRQLNIYETARAPEYEY